MMIKWYEAGFSVPSFRTPLNETNVSNIRLTKFIYLLSSFFFSLKLFSNFELLILLRINSHNFGASNLIKKNRLKE